VPCHLPEGKFIPTGREERLLHPAHRSWWKCLTRRICRRSTPGSQLLELVAGVHLDPCAVASICRHRCAGKALANLPVSPDAWQQDTHQFREVAERGCAQQEIGISLARWRFLGGFQLLTANSEPGGESSMKIHLHMENLVTKLGHGGHELEIG